MPEYIHPSIASRIIDNSTVAIVAQGLTNSFAVITADKGTDNAFKYITSPSEFIFNYGEPNITKHGQMPVNVIEWLKTSGGTYVLRVAPADATFANAVIDIRTLTNLTNISVKPTLVQVPLASTSGAVDLFLNDPAVPVDAEGYSSNRMMAILPTGRGAFNNNLAFRLTVINDLDETFNFRMYTFEVIERLPSGSETLIEGPFKVSLSPDALGLSRESLFIGDVLAKYSSFFKVTFNAAAYDNLAVTLGGVNPDLVDPITGVLRVIGGVTEDIYLPTGNTVVWENGTVVGKQLDYANFTNITYLAGGVDGDMSPANVDSLKIKGYNGLTDPTVTDKKWTQIDVILDANESVAVKTSMVELARDIRRDCIAICDTGITGNFQQALDWRRNSFAVNTFYAAIFAQDAIVFDQFSGRDIRVTSTFFLASKIPAIDDKFGIHYPFVGPNRGAISGFQSLSWGPTEPQKEQLYKAQINYIEVDPKRTNLGSQLTSQVSNSALSNISVVRALLRIQRETEQLSEDYKFEFESQETFDSFQYNLNGMLQRWKSNGACVSISGTVYASAYDKQQKIARVRISMQFTSIIERIYIDLVVNR